MHRFLLGSTLKGRSYQKHHDEYNSYSNQSNLNDIQCWIRTFWAFELWLLLIIIRTLGTYYSFISLCTDSLRLRLVTSIANRHVKALNIYFTNIWCSPVSSNRCDHCPSITGCKFRTRYALGFCHRSNKEISTWSANFAWVVWLISLTD
jgi:hypothetical protein